MCFNSVPGVCTVHLKCDEIMGITMPRQGWSTVSVRTEDYKTFYEHFEKHKLHYRKQGITSFSGFMAKASFALLDETEQEIEQAAKTS